MAKYVTMLILRGDLDVVDTFKYAVTTAIRTEEEFRQEAGKVNIDDWYFTSIVKAADEEGGVTDEL